MADYNKPKLANRLSAAPLEVRPAPPVYHPWSHRSVQQPARRGDSPIQAKANAGRMFPAYPLPQHHQPQHHQQRSAPEKYVPKAGLAGEAPPVYRPEATVSGPLQGKLLPQKTHAAAWIKKGIRADQRVVQRTPIAGLFGMPQRTANAARGMAARPVIQAMESSSVNNNSVGIQTGVLPVVDDGKHSNVRVPQFVLDELNKIVLAAQNEGGGSTINPGQAMMDIGQWEDAFGKQQEKEKKKVSSQETYGVGGSQYFPGTFTMITVGSTTYGDSLSNEAKKDYPSASTAHLGVRDSCVHGEIEIIMQYPGVQAVHTTQDCCLFCYGLLASRRYQHQGLRQNPWPQAWTHDYMGFKITSVAFSQFRKNDSVVTITFNGTTRCYRVETQ